MDAVGDSAAGDVAGELWDANAGDGAARRGALSVQVTEMPVRKAQERCACGHDAAVHIEGTGGCMHFTPPPTKNYICKCRRFERLG